jgi:hypothetical protein
VFMDTLGTFSSSCICMHHIALLPIVPLFFCNIRVRVNFNLVVSCEFVTVVSLVMCTRSLLCMARLVIVF